MLIISVQFRGIHERLRRLKNSQKRLLHSRTFTIDQKVETRIARIVNILSFCSVAAQLVESSTSMPKVAGSIPGCGKKIFMNISGLYYSK